MQCDQPGIYPVTVSQVSSVALWKLTQLALVVGNLENISAHQKGTWVRLVIWSNVSLMTACQQLLKGGNVI